MSRTPIREAIRKLELEGLVAMVPRKGAEVADITEKDLRDVLEVRTALEELSIELAIRNMDEEQLDNLKKANEAFAREEIRKVMTLSRLLSPMWRFMSIHIWQPVISVLFR